MILKTLKNKLANWLYPERELDQKSKQTLRDMTQLQCSNGNWNYDAYMHGMANGMIFALSLFEAGEPQYLDAPEEWLADAPEVSYKGVEVEFDRPADLAENKVCLYSVDADLPIIGEH